MAEILGDQSNNYVNLPVAAVAIYEGYVYMWNGSNYLTVITAHNSAAFAVAAKSTIDPQLGTALTMSAGDSWAFFLLGSGEVVNVAALASEEWDAGGKVYLAQDGGTDGMVSIDPSTSAVCIGHYVGPADHTTGTTDGELIPVLLDVASTAAVS